MTDTIAPKEKVFLDIKLVQECMDAHAGRIAIAFANYLQTKYRYCELSQGWYDYKNDPNKHWVANSKHIYKLFIESITTKS